jgi:hypothetical protein
MTTNSEPNPPRRDEPAILGDKGHYDALKAIDRSESPLPLYGQRENHVPRQDGRRKTLTFFRKASKLLTGSGSSIPLVRNCTESAEEPI